MRESGEQRNTKRPFSTMETLSPTIAPFHSRLDGRKIDQECRSLRLEVERLQASLESERSRSEQQILSREKRIAELEKDRRFLHKEEQALRERLDRVEREAREKTAGLQHEMTQAKGRLGQLLEEKSLWEGEKRRLLGQLEHLCDEVAGQRKGHAHEVEGLKADCKFLKEKVAEKEAVIESLRAASSKDPSPNESAERGKDTLVSPLDTTGLLERINRLEVANRRLQMENNIYRESSRNHLILEERLHAAEKSVVRLHQVEEQCNLLQMRVKELETAKPFLVDGPTDGGTIRELMEKTAKYAKLQESFGDMEASLRAAQAKAGTLDSQVNELKEVAALDKKQVEEVKQKLALAQQHEAIWKTEIGMLKEQIEAVERVERTSQMIIMNLNKKIADPPTQ